jgi:hypothetical protein
MKMLSSWSYLNRGLRVEQQVEVPVEYEGIEVGRHRLDLFVEGTWIAVELCEAHVGSEESDIPES